MNYLMKYILVLMFTGIFFVNASAQKRIEREANNLYNNLQYMEAVSLYKTLDAQNPSLDYKIRIAESYRRANMYDDAEYWYQKVVSSEVSEPVYKFFYAEILRNNGNYELATEYYKQYFTINENTIKYINAAQNPEQFITDEEGIYQVTNLKNFNTEQGEFPCFLYPDNNRLIITSSRNTKNISPVYGWNNEKYYNLYELDLAKKSTKEIKGKVNSYLHEGPAVINPVTQEMVFTRNNFIDKKKQLDIDNTLNLSIFFANKGTKQKYNKITPFWYNSKSYSNGHPTFDEKGNIMLFVSNMPGGFGGTDIYMCIREGYGWGNPVNLGPTINTDRNEMFPFLSADGNLYFSSEGHPGLGGLDIFIAEKTGERQWSEPQNMSSPINSSRDDYAFILNKNGDAGFLGSNRTGGEGSDDIYLVTMNKKMVKTIKEKPCDFVLSGIITDEEKKTALVGARITAIEDISKEKVVAITSENGNYELKLRCNSVYKINFEKDQYYTKSTPYISEEGKARLDESLLRIVVDKAIQVSNIYYDLDKYDIRADAAKELDKLVKMLKDNSKLIIELSSHTDSRGSNTYNQTLSENRAKAAVAYMVSKGIDNRRLYPKGYGENKLINECSDGVKCSEEKHASNRRTEFRVIGFRTEETDESLIAKTDKFEMVLLTQDYQLGSKTPDYYVQIGVFKTPDLNVIEKYNDLGIIKYEDAGNDMKRVLIGVYKKYSIASTYLEKAKLRGTKDAFVVAYIDGKKVTIEEAIQKEK